MSFDPEKVTFFAKTDARGKQIPFGIKAKDRQRHMYVVGKTGMGKSTLLENMAAQDIQNGEGMAFIDPHGSAAETLLDYVPEHRINDVVYFAPFDLANPVSFNVMEDVGADKRHLVVSGLMSTFKKIWVDAWSARMEYILTNALLVLIEYPDTTLLSVNRLFSDKAYRKQVVEYSKDPAVKAFWTEEFANYTDRFAAEALPAIQNKIGQFTGNPLIRNIIGQPHSSFDIRKIMDEKKILIMNLSKGLVGETNANLIGSMLTTRIYLAAMSRADLPVEQMRTMPNFYFYVDEFQSFANATFANILSEARKYHLNLVIAHQYIEQMEEDVRNAVFGNVGTTISFRVGPFDAEVLETVFSPRFLATDLVNLGFAQIYLSLMIDGIGSQPFSAITLPPVERPHTSCKGMVVAASRKNYAKTREEVDQLIIDLHTPVKVEPPAPKKNPQSQPNLNGQANPANQQTNPNNQVAQSNQTSQSNQAIKSESKDQSRKENKEYNNAASNQYNKVVFNSGATREIKNDRNDSTVNSTVVEKKEQQIENKPASEHNNNHQNNNKSNHNHQTSNNKSDHQNQNNHQNNDKPNNHRNQNHTNSSKPEFKGKPPVPTRSPEELRAVLSKLAEVEKSKSSSNKVSDNKEKLEKSENINSDKKEPELSPLRSALADVLRQAQVSTLEKSSKEKAESSKIMIKDVPPEVIKIIAPTPDDAEVIRKEFLAKERAELERLTVEAEEAFTQLNQVPEEEIDDPLAPKKIEKLFRTSHNERSPFAS
jgi:hypothetical protein